MVKTVWLMVEYDDCLIVMIEVEQDDLETGTFRHAADAPRCEAPLQDRAQEAA